METEHPDTEGMHRLFDDALADADLTGDVVPGVLTGYERTVKVRRYQTAGVALAVLATATATAGVAVSALPRGGATVRPPEPAASSAASGPDYCTHQHWVSTPNPDVEVVNELSSNPAADQANCEALRTALHATVPEAQLVPRYFPDLTLDPRLDQAQVKKVNAEIKTDPLTGTAEQTKYFGSELKYLAVHPEDPANVYSPYGYELVTADGRDLLEVSGPGNDKQVAEDPLAFVGSAASSDCAKMPPSLSGVVQCTPVGTAGGWHGALWRGPEPIDGAGAWTLTAVVTGPQATSIRVTDGLDTDAWYRAGMYDGTLSTSIDQNTKWINRWSGQTAVGKNPPAAHVVTEQQLAQFLDSPAFQAYADSYRTYIDNLPQTQGSETADPVHSH